MEVTIDTISVTGTNLKNPVESLHSFLMRQPLNSHNAGFILTIDENKAEFFDNRLRLIRWAGDNIEALGNLLKGARQNTNFASDKKAFNGVFYTILAEIKTEALNQFSTLKTKLTISWAPYSKDPIIPEIGDYIVYYNGGLFKFKPEQMALIAMLTTLNSKMPPKETKEKDTTSYAE